MKPEADFEPAPASFPWMAGLRLGLAAVFIVAGTLKLWQAPQMFADSIASFRLLPKWAVNPLALGLPPFEIVAGFALLAARFQRLGAFCVLLMSVSFLLALILAQVRGIPVECNCFGGGPSWLPLTGSQKVWLDVVRDAALAAGALVLYRHDANIKTV